MFCLLFVALNLYSEILTKSLTFPPKRQRNKARISYTCDRLAFYSLSDPLTDHSLLELLSQLKIFVFMSERK